METFALSDGEFGITFCLPLHGADGWLNSFVVTIVEPGLSANVKVENSELIQGPDALFSDIALNWKGWAGEKTWRSLEAEIYLFATSDQLGDITIRVVLRPAAFAEAWQVVSYAHFEAGQLDSLRNRAIQFFGRES